MNWKDRIARFKGWKWLIIGSVVGAVISLIWLLFINNVGEEWLGFIGGILGSIIGILGTFYVLSIQLKKDKEALDIQLQQDKEQNRRNQVDNTFFNLLDMHLKMKNTIEENNTFETFYNEIGLDANKMIQHIGTQKIIEADGIVDNLTTIYDAYVEKMKEILIELDIDVSGIPKETNKKLGYLIKQLSENYEVGTPGKEENDKKADLVSYSFHEAASDVHKLIDMIENEFISNVDILPKLLGVYHSILEYKVDTEANEALKKIALEAKKYHNKAGKYQLITATKDKQRIINNVSQKYYSQLASYFRLTHRILKYINENVDKQAEKENYLGFLRATMDEKELLTLFYASSYSNRGEGLKQQFVGTNFFGKKGELGEDKTLAQHFNKDKLFWPEEDIKLMQCFTI
ncbi:TPA: putative phage abortive infection protein [Enterococcus faecium]|uniref:putative phage abortive infection protein n=1 Tax=Enterococcus faecium TaxID=1352 RepID=UPI00207AD09B|nr:putative phage abortive infection protein [Enterococcus faecium]MCU1831433.1 putative phage abortive infection protein [Enterococcus faecium]MCZ1826691.1 putative phage abortive infection protein [Enterococcus faecium]MDT6503608.1 putative phage abortive infection protein [Enterococcus faecium]MDT6517673.1 putative phage abortive infection protein [Enterococcus faecium]MDT6580153.1 putative phage abortive infection protein [Enterococcus faecium]